MDGVIILEPWCKSGNGQNLGPNPEDKQCQTPAKSTFTIDHKMSFQIDIQNARPINQADYMTTLIN
jgi:hypothetical protein